MKKSILIGLAVLLALALVTCDYTPNAIGEEEFTNVIFGPDRVTILFDDVVPKSDARALTQPLAEAGLEVFEVVFMTDTAVVRASWKYGRSVVLKNVPRGADADGVDYAKYENASLAPKIGAAILFAGRNDTLLAVGKVIAVNDDITKTIVDVNSRSVTFGLAALTTEDPFTVPSPTTGEHKVVPTFITTPPLSVPNPPPGTLPTREKQLDGHVLLIDTTHDATYELGSASSTFPIAEILKGVIVTNANEAVVKLEFPKYITGFGNHILLPSDYATELTGTIGSTVVTNTALPAVIPMEIDSGELFGIISFYFQIPVAALANLPSTDADAGGIAVPVQPLPWFVRPGFEYSYLDIENRAGGCVLVFVANENQEGKDFRFSDIDYLDYYNNGLEIKAP